MISIDRVSKSFETPSGRVSAVDDVTLHIPDGAVCSVMGPSGSGKSTLLNLVAGLVLPDTGAVTLDGRLSAACLSGSDAPSGWHTSG